MRAEEIVNVGAVGEGRVRLPRTELSSGSSSSVTSLGSQSMRASMFGTTLRSEAYKGGVDDEVSRRAGSSGTRRKNLPILSAFARTARRLSRGGPRARTSAAAARAAFGDEASTSDSATLNSEETDEEEAVLNRALREASDVSSIHSRESGGGAIGAIGTQGASPTSADEASIYSKGDEGSAPSRGGSDGSTAVAPMRDDAERSAACAQLPADALRGRRTRRKSVSDVMARRATLSKEKKAKSRFLAIVTQAMHADLQVTPKCMFSHTDSRRLMAWDILICILVVYVAIFAPFEIAFTPSITTLGATTEGESSFLQIPPLTWFAINACISAVWTLDIILHFRISTERKDGRANYDVRRIAIHYLSGWFVIDVIATVPWELLLLVGGGSHGGALITRAPRMARILRIPRIVKVSRFYRLWRTWHPTALARIKFSWLRTVGSVFVVLIVVHWMACGFYLLHEVQGDGENSWVTKLDDIQNDSAWRLEQLYVATLYWSVMTLTTIGYGDIAPENTGERIYTICTMFVGAILFSFILSEIAALLDTMRWRTSAFKARIDSVGAYLERKNLPPWLRRKCIDFLFEAHAKSSMGTLAGWGLPADSGIVARPPSGIALGDGGGVEGALLWLFSPYLRNMIGYQLFAPFFNRTPEFASLSPDFLGQLAMQLVPVAYGAREYIYVIGDAATSMYFLATGCVCSHCCAISSSLVRDCSCAHIHRVVTLHLFISLMGAPTLCLAIHLTRTSQPRPARGVERDADCHRSLAYQRTRVFWARRRNFNARSRRTRSGAFAPPIGAHAHVLGHVRAAARLPREAVRIIRCGAGLRPKIRGEASMAVDIPPYGQGARGFLRRARPARG